MGQNDTIGKIELNPLSSCQVIILIARMTLHSLVLSSDSFSCNCNSINSHLSIGS